MEPFLGQLALFGFNFVPRGWAACNGQLMSIAQNSALFSLLGTTYGGDGVTTFGLPDLRGRLPMNFGQGPGLPDYQIGETGGSPSVALTVANLPSHNHGIVASNALGSSNTPAGNFAAGTPVTTPPGGPYAPGGANAAMNPAVVTPTGGNQPVSTQSPYLALNWCIATQGVFPSRS